MSLPESFAKLVNRTPSTLSAGGYGFLMPVLTTTQRLALVAPDLTPGLEVYDSTLNQKFYWNGTAWVSLVAGGANKILATTIPATAGVSAAGWRQVASASGFSIAGWPAPATLSGNGTFRGVEIQWDVTSTWQVNTNFPGSQGLGIPFTYSMSLTGTTVEGSAGAFGVLWPNLTLGGATGDTQFAPYIRHSGVISIPAAWFTPGVGAPTADLNCFIGVIDPAVSQDFRDVATTSSIGTHSFSATANVFYVYTP